MASISQEERAKIIANNKSLRIIKNEMDQLLERGGITDEQYGNLVDLLPAEASLRNLSTPVPAANNSSTSLGNFGALTIADRQPSHSPAPQAENPPPAYHNPVPPPPPRNEGPPELCRVVALYRYADADPRDCDFEVGDQISVTNYANNEWWSGKNLRTNKVGIFPRNYVQVDPHPTGYYGNNEKQGSYYGAQSQTPNNASNPYSAPVPPMAIANQDEQQQQSGEAGKQPSKAGEMGKKFGKKLGNAAIFGAGATLGADLVNSIF